jgi:hypothetical protein
VDALSWLEAMRRWRDYIRDSRETAVVFENPDGDRVRGSDPNRFMQGYAAKQYAKLKDLERGIRANYGKRLHSAMLTLTSSTTDGDGRPRSPVDHLDDLLSSWEAVRRALARTLEDWRWEYLAILEPHKSGHLHVHIAVFVDGVVVPDVFRPVMEAHVRNCDGAREEAHRVMGERAAVSVKHVGGERQESIGNLGTYLAEYLGTYDGDPLAADEQVQMANAVLWATNRQRWRPSQGAQEYMRTGENDEESEWELVGIEDGDGELYEVGGGAGGVSRMVTATDSILEDEPPPDPPPESDYESDVYADCPEQSDLDLWTA